MAAIGLIMATTLATLAGPNQAQAAETDLVYFPETGHHVPERFFKVWEQYDLAILGYPVSEPIDQDGRLTQYFERAVFQYFPEHEGTAYEVQFTLLGRQLAGDRTDPPFQPLAEPPSPDANFYPETGHSLAGTFRDYWERHGGLYVFGYPISEPFEENGRLVQYFERARFEHWPEHAGTQYEVQLGLLGRDAAVAAGVSTAAVPRKEGVPDWRYTPEPRSFNIPILMYHQFGEPESRYQIAYWRFSEQLDWLQANGYQAITMTQLYDAIYQGGWLPEKPVVLTFDDAYAGQWTAADILDEHSMPGVFYITLDQEGGLRDDQIADLSARGHEIASHTHTHPFLTTRSDEALQWEIADSRQQLQAITGEPIDFFAYPFGDYDNRVIAAVEAAGYRGAVAAWGGNWITPEKRWTQPRIEIDGGISLDTFAGWVTGSVLQQYVAPAAH